MYRFTVLVFSVMYSITWRVCVGACVSGFMCLLAQRCLCARVIGSLKNMSCSPYCQVPQHQQKVLVCSALHFHIQSHSDLGIAERCRISPEETRQTKYSKYELVMSRGPETVLKWNASWNVQKTSCFTLLLMKNASQMVCDRVTSNSLITLKSRTIKMFLPNDIIDSSMWGKEGFIFNINPSPEFFWLILPLNNLKGGFWNSNKPWEWVLQSLIYSNALLSPSTSE